MKTQTEIMKQKYLTELIAHSNGKYYRTSLLKNTRYQLLRHKTEQFACTAKAINQPGVVLFN